MENDPSQQIEKGSIKVYNLGISEQDASTNSLISMEMQDTHKIGFRRKSTRRKSIDKIFQKVEKLDVEEVDRSILRSFPRRSCADSLDLSYFRNNKESDDDEQEQDQDDNVVKMLDLKIGEQNPLTNSLVALEMQDTKKTGFRRGGNDNRRRKSIDKIFDKYNDVHIVHNVDKSKLASLPRRSLASSDIESIRRQYNESDDEDNHKADDDKSLTVQMLQLNIGENETSSKSLVALEMHDTKKTGFRKKESGSRRKSIDKIFSKVKSCNVDCDVDQSILRKVPRRSLANDFDLSSIRNQNNESDSETDK